MRVFVTGASGWIGSVATTQLLEHGHEVVGLARSDASAAAVEKLGAAVVRGDLADLDLLREQASRADATVHLAFRHDVAFSGDFATAAASDRAAIEALGVPGTALVIASGTLGVAPGRVAVETDRPDPGAHPRVANAALTLALPDVRSVVIRFAPTVHGVGDGGFVATLLDIARTTGVSGYLGDGSSRWPACHVSDAGDLVRRAVEGAPAQSVLHATGEDGVATKAIAQAIGGYLDVPVRPVDDPAHFRFLAGFFGMDAPASSELTRDLLGWTPTGPTLVEDIAAGAY